MAALFKMVCRFCFLTKKRFASQLLIMLRRKALYAASKAASNTAVLSTFLDL